MELADLIGTIALTVSIGALAWQVWLFAAERHREKNAEIQTALNAVRISIARLFKVINERLYLFAEMDATAAKSMLKALPGPSNYETFFKALSDDKVNNLFVSSLSEAVNGSRLRRLIGQELAEIGEEAYRIEFRIPLIMEIISRSTEALDSVCRDMTSPLVYLSDEGVEQLPPIFDGSALRAEIENLAKQAGDTVDDVSLLPYLLQALQLHRIDSFNEFLQPIFNALSGLVTEVIALVLTLSERDLRRLIESDRKLFEDREFESDPVLQITSNISRLNSVVSDLNDDGAYKIRAVLRQLVDVTAKFQPNPDNWLVDQRKRFRILEES